MEPDLSKFQRLLFAFCFLEQRIELPSSKVVLIHEVAVVAAEDQFRHFLALLQPFFFSSAVKLLKLAKQFIGNVDTPLKVILRAFALSPSSVGFHPAL